MTAPTPGWYSEKTSEVRRVVILASIALLCGRYFASYPGVNRTFAQFAQIRNKAPHVARYQISGFRRIYVRGIYEGDRASDYAARGAAMILESLGSNFYHSIFCLTGVEFLAIRSMS